ncbi:DNA mismatch repair protein MutS [Candidatus Protochlamydia phocaeensis]|uniref:DNA mismatch repair protein MutS n=1 Tax=Candidatus Protochlamydia phocaeensis TaxID=1414722 RepID=UPI000838456D|nr:DNA mismatch repair protein MutS [Candidatus Protochlamydia phocaeensis]
MQTSPSPIQSLSFDENKASPTPMMVQWHACKKMAPDAVLLFRMGDFYEAFYEDAHLLAKELDLTLTRRQDIPMSGVPFHTSETYIDKLVAKGFRVAVAEQVEDPKKAKGLVKREIVRVVTPGTVINSNLLSDKNNNFFAALHRTGQVFGLAFLDLTTGEFCVSEFMHERDLLNELYRLHPAEFLTSQKFKEKYGSLFDEIHQTYAFLLNTQEDWHFEHQTAYDFLVQHFQVHSLDGFGLNGMVAAINAAGALLRYLKDALCLPIEHIQDMRPYSTSQFLLLDRMTQRNLELTHSLQDGSRRNTLLGVLDQTATPMGARLLQHWVKQPLLSVEEIRHRQNGIQAFLDHEDRLYQFRERLIHIRDLERLMMKVSAGYATPRDLVALHHSFQPIQEIKALLASLPSSWIQSEANKLDPLPHMNQLIAQALVDEPPLRLGEGKTFRDGYHRELDELREISRDSKAWMARYQTQIREETGIKTLKVGFNKMFGYYIEVSRGQSEKMPATFIRRQTLVNAERYITPELKDYESKVLTAEERIESIESELFHQLRADISHYTQAVLSIAQALARLDCLSTLAEVAQKMHYTCPKVDEGFALDIEEGRHPVIEAACMREKFVPNDTHLDDQHSRLLLITGPNMAGKSTYLRQVALIVILAQMGSFVPAKRAHIGLVDKVFTRIGASDDLSRGQSTFMVEMSETANILNNVTSRSLVILDEIGRGTSTYDGISIAWSVAEYLLTTENRMAKTLFATHYWELTKLEEKVPGAVNYNVAVHEAEDHITFLRKIVKGGTDKSYGIHVARLAGLPSAVIQRAKDILEHLEENANRKSAFEPSRIKRPASAKLKVPQTDFQLSLFEG